jgi:hypothetical protein
LKQQVRIIRGTYKGQPVVNQIFAMAPAGVINSKKGAAIAVVNNGSINAGVKCARIAVESHNDFEILNEPAPLARRRGNPYALEFNVPMAAVIADEPVSTETDEEAMDRIATRFKILDEMSLACINGDVRAMIVSGPPGVGKSFGVESQLEKSALFDQLAGKKIRYEVVKGALTALGLYAILYKYSDAKNVLVFDDADGVFADELSLNILKAALDSGKRRRIFWNSDSAMLRREGIPDCFDFKGSVIFITNINFASVKSKKLQDHLTALQSRCHYLDLTISTTRDKLLRIRQVHRDALKDDVGGLFKDYEFEGDEADQVLDFMETNHVRLRELSLRMCLKIADLIKISPERWRMLAENTVMHSS